MRRPSNLTRFLVPRLQDFLFILILAFILLFGSNLFRDGDPGRHITAGRYMLSHRMILVRDIFSYTLFGQPLTPHEWLAQIAFGAADAAFGLGGVVFLSGWTIATTIVLIYREISRLGLPRLAGIGLALCAAAMTSAHWLARPHLFTLLFLALWTPRLRRLVKGEPVPLWHFPLIMLLWANTHGAFIAGFVVWGAVLVGILWDRAGKSVPLPGRMIQNLLLAGGFSFLVSFINPVGWHLWATSLGYITNRYLVDLTSEYRSLDFHTIGAWPFLIFLTATIFLLSRGWKKINTSDGLLLAGWTALGLYSGRNMPIFAVVATPIVADYLKPYIVGTGWITRLTDPIEQMEKNLRGAFWSILSLVITAVLLSSGRPLDYSHTPYQFNKVDFPVDAVSWLTDHPQSGHMFNFFPWGGYLIYRLWPEQKVFIDGQLDFYGPQFTEQYQQVILAKDGWQDVFQTYQVEWVILPPDQPISLVLMSSPGWSILYRDPVAVILRKQ